MSKQLDAAIRHIGHLSPKIEQVVVEANQGTTKTTPEVAQILARQTSALNHLAAAVQALERELSLLRSAHQTHRHG